MDRLDQAISSLQTAIHSSVYVAKHRMHPRAFTRHRKLPFAMVISVILRLAKKSLQIECNLLGELLMTEPVSKQAFSKARHNIRYTGFKELHTIFLENTYQGDNTGTWFGYRVFGVDGSTIKLPKSEETIEYFGTWAKRGDDPSKCPVLARVSEVVELTTGIIVSADLAPMEFGERGLADKQIKDVSRLFQKLDQPKQLYVFDRGYVSKDMMRNILKLKNDFVFRIPRRFNPEIDKLIDKGAIDCLIDIKGLPTLRLVIRVLPSGEKCVLLTSILDSSISGDAFYRLYWLRWTSCEEGYKKQKIQLELENFSGTSLESVLQEFWATVVTLSLFLLCCIEEEGPWDPERPSPSNRINRSVVFGSLRDTVFRTLLGEFTPNDLAQRFRAVASRSRERVKKDRQFSRAGVGKPKRHHVFRRTC